jgi:membrane protease subunit HflK
MAIVKPRNLDKPGGGWVYRRRNVGLDIGKAPRFVKRRLAPEGTGLSWNNNGGGGGPWGGPGGQTPWGRGGKGPARPPFDELLRRGQRGFRGLLPGGWGRGTYIVAAVAAIVALWLLSGFYRVEPDEQGVVLRFGAFDRITEPGLNYHLPAPIESVELPKVTRVNPIEIGYRLSTPSGYRVTSGGEEVPEESLMLTGDENIVDINFTVFWVIKDAKQYLFNIRNPELVVKAAAESAMREVIGHTDIARAFAEGRGKIKTDTEKLTQEILDSYNSGIAITDLQLQKVDPPGQVIDAFRDVQSAKIDLNTLVNQAQAYRNDIVPRAHGDAARVVQEAEAYRQQVVLKAQGEASRFLSVYHAYQLAKDVTTTRLYLETLEAVLKGANKVILDKGAAGAGVLPYLPLPALKLPPPAAAPAKRSGQ